MLSHIGMIASGPLIARCAGAPRPYAAPGYPLPLPSGPRPKFHDLRSEPVPTEETIEHDDMRHHFDRITQQIIAAIEAGPGDCTLPWHNKGRCLDQPINAITAKRYRGLNILGLWLSAAADDFSSGRWASYRQWAAIGAQVRKGEKGTPIFFWQSRAQDDQADEGGDTRRRGYIARTYFVFNEDQVEGAPENPSAGAMSDAADTKTDVVSFFDGLEAKVVHGGDRACYVPSRDVIHLPPFEQFESAEAYFSVRAHETVHWTGPKHRLHRDLTGRFGTNAYAMEELVAELGAAFLCSALGVSPQPRKDHAAYLASWLKVMRGDNKAVLTAAGKAQQAVDFLIQHEF